MTAPERNLPGSRPFLVLEITRSSPVDQANGLVFRSVRERPRKEFRGRELVDRVLALVERVMPVQIWLVGGEPLVRRAEIGRLLPQFDRLGIEVQLATGALLPIPYDYRTWDNLTIVVMVDALQPGTCARIVDNISGHGVVVHCDIDRPLACAPRRLREFVGFWSSRDEVLGMWFSLRGLTLPERAATVAELASIRRTFPKVFLPDPIRSAFLHPPSGPDACAFARMTHRVSPDFVVEAAPCPLGGNRVCSECGSIASARLSAIGGFLAR